MSRPQYIVQCPVFIAFMACLRTRSVAQATYRRIRKLNDIDGGGRGLIWGTVPAFAWRGLGKPEEPQNTRLPVWSPGPSNSELEVPTILPRRLVGHSAVQIVVKNQQCQYCICIHVPPWIGCQAHSYVKEINKQVSAHSHFYTWYGHVDDDGNLQWHHTVVTSALLYHV